MAMAFAGNLSIAFPFSKNKTGSISGLPRCTKISKQRNPEREAGSRLLVARASGNGGSCCGGGGSSNDNGGNCSSHAKSADLSNVGKEFEAMVAKATLTEFEKEYQSSEMKGNITRDVMREVMDIGPTSYAHQQKGETIFDLNTLLSQDKNEDFAFDNTEDVFV
ncbi:hypothetical protein KI387_035191 [Taxus chinensis]|uniref:Uncharacterized protein n=1 Tax=Taxus chinensis TaxID=29808 RepID=A0AA38KYU6_TAXCH|nr:hypothetical protein KI387_035191 [Taxus chinensis]